VRYDRFLAGDLIHLKHDFVLELTGVANLDAVELDLVALLNLLGTFCVCGVRILDQFVENLLLFVDRVGETALSTQLTVHSLLDAL
jgi:hypothetical protein